jgi:penicillin-binding protein 1A
MQEPENLENEPVRRRGCAGLFIFIMLILGACWGAGLGMFLWMVNDATSDVSQAFADFRPKVGSKVFSSDGQLLGEFTVEERQLLRLCDIPLRVQKAFVATEDASFYQHKGVRPDAYLSVALQALQTGRVRGGSTITMQVVRNIDDLNVGTEHSYKRKLREALVALQIERKFTKDEILELYLNQIFLGISAWGVEAASQQYFGKSCQDLTLGEAATLAGLTRWPNTNNPIRNLENACGRRGVVLKQMLDEGFITREEHDAAAAEDLAAQVVKPEQIAENRAAAMTPSRRFKAPYFVEEVRKFVQEKFENEKIFQDGLEIYTTIDMRLQDAAERALLKGLNEFDDKQRKMFERQGKPDEFTPAAGALICIDNRPQYRGFVRAMVGGRDYEREKYNTVTQAKRQPGSSIKPFVWAAAVASGLTPSTVVVDAPFSRVAPNGKVWSPKNFDNSYNGPIPIRHALEKSLNIVSVKLTDMVGAPVVRSYLQRCGIPTEVEGLTIALGSPEVRPIDHCVAYSCFPNGGMRHESVMVTDIRDRDGVQRLDYHDYTRVEQAIDPRVAYVALHMMEGVCTPGNGFYPTGWRASSLKRPVGGKTGTTNNSRDAWFCGFTADYTTVVWIGYRDNRSLGKGRDYTGGRLSCPVWTEFMTEAEEGLPVRDFDVPYGVEFFNIDRFTGVEGGSYKEAYISGTRPPSTFAAPPSGDGAAEPDAEANMPMLEAL